MGCEDNLDLKKERHVLCVLREQQFNYFRKVHNKEQKKSRYNHRHKKSGVRNVDNINKTKKRKAVQNNREGERERRGREGEREKGYKKRKINARENWR